MLKINYVDAFEFILLLNFFTKTFIHILMDEKDPIVKEKKSLFTVCNFITLITLLLF